RVALAVQRLRQATLVRMCHSQRNGASRTIGDMIAGSGAVARSLTVVAVLLAGLVLAGVPRAFAVTSHRPLNDTRAVGAQPVRVGFPIEYFGVVGELASPSSHLSERGRAPFGEARFRVQGSWTP